MQTIRNGQKWPFMELLIQESFQVIEQFKNIAVIFGRLSQFQFLSQVSRLMPELEVLLNFWSLKMKSSKIIKNDLFVESQKNYKLIISK
jgi:hypothetical protein